ncbi:DUF3825 domain-containing protein [Stomatobaculum longum]|uniref:DUF3825 domain-containing protein n=1 Tax=Stomatobaculum longum TaxID=796942 RepID=UPI0028E7F007|nr:DUF3825 domain-containing protein [Stomatobaculum longum]
MHPEEREKLAPHVWNIIRERQASPDNMVDIATLSPLFAEAGLRHTDYGFETLRDFLSEFREYLTMVDGISAGAGLPAKSYVQLKNFEKLENAEVQKADVPKDKELFAGPELSAAEKSDLEEKLREVFAAVVSDEAGWVNLAGLGAPLKENGVDAKQLGFQKIMPFLEQFPELLELKREPSPSGKAWVAYARLRAAETALPAGLAGCAQATVPALGSDESSQAELSAEEKTELSPKVCSAVRAAISNEEGWVNLAGIGEALKGNGIDVKLLGFQKILPFLEQFPELLELKHEPTASGKAWVAYARLRENERREGDGKAEKAAAKPYAPRQGMSEYRTPESKFPSKDSWLFHWSRIPNLKIKELAEKALAEKWYYGAANAADAENYPILKNYLAYTFKRLVFEDKILYGDVADAEHAGEEYAAFNTGLVDQKYEYIYALFKKNTMSPQPYWYLLDFVVAGEQSGKTLARLFYPLPKRADYFENQFRNMVYDTSTQLLCDYTHIIVERIGRFPLRFLQENCPPNMLEIDGVKLEEVYPKHAKDSERKHYFEQLGERIRNTPMVLNNLKNRLEAAIHLTLKRVEWNYKTAIPVYFPTRNLCSLLLPLCLSEESQVDLALVVEPLQSGAYQGQTVLPLDLAYNNSRLLTRPDSDWLRPDSIQSNGSDDEEE